MKKKISRIRGFTLVELIVTVAVFSIVSSIILYNYSQFNTNILISNYAYDVALSIRQAQVYGVSVRQNTNAATGVSDFNGSYGVHFGAPAAANSLIFFADAAVNGNPNHYDSGSADEKIDSRALPNNYSFSRFCAKTASGTASCSDGATGPITYLDISFTRPEPDAIIQSSDPASLAPGYYQSAFICVKSPLGKTRKVVADSTGQISVSVLPADPECAP